MAEGAEWLAKAKAAAADLVVVVLGELASRYWDLSSKPLYPFGYGLSYFGADVGRPILAAAAFSGGQGRLKAGCGQNARPTRSKLVVTV